MTDYTNNLYMEQIISESEIKGTVCSRFDCIDCDNLVACYIDASKQENSNEDLNYGGYETETHF